MIGTSHVPMSEEHGPIEKILAAYQTHASNSLKGPALSRAIEPRIPNYSNNFDLYNYYLQYQQEFLSPSWLESENNSKGPPEIEPDFQAYFNSLSSQKVDQHRAAMAQLFSYYQQYCHAIPTLPPHFAPYMVAPTFMTPPPNFKPYQQQQLYWPPPPQPFIPYHNDNHKTDLAEDNNAKTHTSNSNLSLSEEISEQNSKSNEPQTPLNLPDLLTTKLEGCPVPCFDVGGELRLCLPQLLNAVLGRFALRQINAACDRLHIYCSRCDPDQLIALKRTQLLSLAAPDCGLITKTDAQRLCDHLLRASPLTPHRSRDVAAWAARPDSPGFDVYHECFGRCRGRVHPDLYLSPAAKCVECLECGTFLAPPQFVSHSHRPPERRVCHWGFDRERWRSYLLLVSPEITEQLPSDHVIEGVDTRSETSRQSSAPHVTERPQTSRNSNEINETKLKAFKEKFLDLLEDQSNHISNGHYNPDLIISPAKPVKIISRPSVINLSNRPPPKKRARSGATFQPIDYSLGPTPLKKIYNSTPSPSEGKRFQNASSDPNNYFYSDTNIPKCLTPLTTSYSTLDDSTPKSISNPLQNPSLKSPPLSKSVNADDKLKVKQSSASLDLSLGESWKRKRFLSTPEDIYSTTQDQKDMTQKFLAKLKISNDGPNFVHTDPCYDSAVELPQISEKDQKQDITPLNCLKTVTSHFVDLSKDLMLEIDNHAKKIIHNSNPLVFDELKARLLGHLTLKHDTLQSYLTQVFKSNGHL